MVLEKEKHKASMEPKRFVKLDVAKGIGIILVVLGHLEPSTYLMRFIYSFHVFLFFVCSGFIGVRYEKNNIKDTIEKNIKRLLYPYLLWNIVSQSVDLLLKEIDIIQAFKNLLFLNANVGWNAALWFLPSLFLTDTVGSFVIKFNFMIQSIIELFSFLLWVFIAKTGIALPFGLYTVPVSLLFWILGYWARKYQIMIKISELNKNSIIIMFTISLLICLIGGTVFNSTISIYHIKFNNFIFTLVAGISGILCVYSISALVKGKVKELLRFYGMNSMTILCTHYFLLRLIGTVSEFLMGINMWRYTSSIKSILLTIVVLFIYFFIIRAKKEKTAIGIRL